MIMIDGSPLQQEIEELQQQLAPLKAQLASYQDLPPVRTAQSVA